MPTRPAPVSIGIAGSLGPDLAAALAPMVDATGFEALWINDTPGGDAIAAVAAAAESTATLRIGIGVIPVDRRPAAEIVDAVRASGFDQRRLTLGIGSGHDPKGSLDRVRDALGVLERDLDARVVVGALGPRMRHLAAAGADGVVLNWLTPEVAAEQSAEAHAVRPDTHVTLYVRVALEPAASDRLATEVERYASIPSYAANFERMGVAAADTVIADAAGFAARLAAYRDAVDEVVLRAITPDDSLASYEAFVRAAAQAL